MLIAPKGHFFTQIPHPIQRRSEMKAIFESGETSMHNFPVLTTGHDFLHSWRHFWGFPSAKEDARTPQEVQVYLWFALIERYHEYMIWGIDERSMPYLVIIDDSNTMYSLSNKPNDYLCRKWRLQHTESIYQTFWWGKASLNRDDGAMRILLGPEQNEIKNAGQWMSMNVAEQMKRRTDVLPGTNGVYPTQEEDILRFLWLW